MNKLFTGRPAIFWWTLCSGFVLVYSLSYFLTEILPYPNLWYYPVLRRWEFGFNPSAGLKMGWYGKVLWSVSVSMLWSMLWALLWPLWKKHASFWLACFDLGAMASTLYVLFYIARVLSTRY